MSEDVQVSVMTAFLLSTMCYYQTTHFSFTYDDAYAIVHNPIVSGELVLQEVFRRDFWGNELGRDDVWTHKSWRPLPTLIYRIVWKFVCEADQFCVARRLHWLNVLGYGVCSGLAVVATRRTMQRFGRQKHGNINEVNQISFLAGAFFCLHPVHVEVVANITHGCEILCAIFVFLGIAVWGGKRDGKELPWWRVGCVGLCGVLATACKETGLMLLVFVAALDTLLFFEGIGGVRTGAFCFCIFASIVRKRHKLTDGTSFDISVEFNPLIKYGRNESRYWWGVGWAHVDALGLLVCPWLKHFCIDRVFMDIEDIHGDGENSFGRKATVTAVWGVCAGLGFWGLWTRRTYESSRVLVTATLLFIAFYLPASQILFPVGFYVAERTLFIPSLAYCTVLATAVRKFVRWDVGKILAGIILLSFALISLDVSTAWSDNESLSIKTLEINSGR